MDINKVQFTAKLNKAAPPVPFSTIRNNSLKQWASLASYFNDEKWSDAIELSMSMRGEYFAFLGMAKGRAVQLQEKATAFDCAFDVIGEALERFLPTLDDPDKRLEVEKQLEAEGHSPDLLTKVAAKLDKNAKNPLRGTVGPKQADSFSKDLSFAISLGTQGYWGGFLSSFNHYFQQYDTPLESDEIDFCKQYLDEYAQSVSDGFYQLHASYLVGKQEELFSKSNAILHQLAAELDQLAKTTAILSANLERSLESGKVKPRKLGTTTLQAGKLARQWALLAVLSMYSMKIALLPEDHKEVKERINDARKLPFESKISDGKNVTHSSLLENPADYKGKYIEIQGVVSGTAVTRSDDGKLLSHFSLTSPSGEEEIPVIAVYENLKHVGIIDGCYVNINGDWQTDSVLSDQPFLQLRRLSLSKLGDESWMDKMTHILNSWFELFPNGHFIHWSIGPEDKNQDDQKSPKTGGGEIIFKEKFGLTRR